MSIPQPDPASPAQVADASFSTGRRGFDQGEVRDFLRTVADELRRLHERQAFLERELENSQAEPNLTMAHFDDETLTRMLGEETVRILNAARESSHEIREKAEQSAAQMLMEASDESIRLREEAEIEASRRRADATNDAEAEISMAKQQGREMVNEARAYRERVLSELARRRELAREQIEQLVHGRDRLMQAFERARLVAVDVVAEMQPLGEPDEYVNLQPSTGPVPVMVARDAMAPSEAESTDAPADDARADAATDGEATVGIYDHGSDGDAVVENVVDAGTDEGEEADDPDGDVIADVVELNESSAPDDDGEIDAGTDDIDPAESDIDANDDAVTEEPTDVDADDIEAIEDPDDPSDDSRHPDPDDGSVDDVVVDLFARLRATTDDEPEPEAEVDNAEDDAHTDADVIDDAEDADEPIADAPAADPADDEHDAEASDGSDDDTEVSRFEQRDADLTPLIVASARKLKRVLADEQNEVLDALRRSEQVRNLDALLPWASHHAERYAGVISDELLAAANAGATLTTGTSSSKLRAAAGKQAVQQAAETITRGMVTPLRDRLERCIADGDGDNPAITKKVRAVYREFKTKHIDEQLDDVFRAAHGRGVLASFELDTPVQWMPDPSHEICADCDDNRLEGAVAAGQAFPTGHLCTPAHPGCRCLLVPAAR